ncbi:MAG: hypothetical protein ACRDD7_01890 [Peptostreptococcaceae bacterium]
MGRPEDVKELYSSISIPSTIHSYSIAVEYMKKWFLDKFKNNYFKTVHLDGRHVFDEARNFDMIKSLKKLKPSVAITPQLEFDFNRDTLDLYQFGLKHYSRRSKLETSFFKDLDKNMYLSVSMEALQMNFNYRIRLSTRAQQVDLYKYINMACRIGATQGEDIDIDYHIPYSMILQVANDAGFEIKDNRIINVVEFVTYLNSHSIIPVLYKYRTVNGKSEFFLRFKDIYMHINSLTPLSADDGESEGQLRSNYIIDMNVTLRMPTVKMYNYYSVETHDIMDNIELSDEANVGLFGIKIPNIPEKNEKGWNEYLTTEFFCDNNKDNLVINFKELFEGGDLERIISHTNDIHISPSIFIDFKLFNNGDELSYDINWDTQIMTSHEIPVSKITNISVYVDSNYLHKQIINIDELNKDRYRTK